MNTLYYGDNLKVLREHVATACVDLVYLDPPFNSNATYNVLFKAPDGQQSQSQIEAFDDTWHWTDSAGDAYWQVLHGPHSDVARMLEAIHGFLGENDMMAYLAMMAIRLIELHRVLKPTGSLYLHCDPTASHYLKILLDAVFGHNGFRNELVWRRTNAHNKLSRQYGPIHDIILFYTMSDRFIFHPGRRPYSKSYIKTYFPHKDEKGYYQSNVITGAGTRKGSSGQRWRDYAPTDKGRHWAVPQKLRDELVSKLDNDAEAFILDRLDDAGLILHPKERGALPRYKQYLSTSDGVLHQDIWAYQPGTQGLLFGTEEGVDQDVKWLDSEEERLGYPTQKPVALLERIISASSNPGDLVLDPFCGCGTTVHAAQKLGRNWIGIDVTPLAIALIRRRLSEAFGSAAQFRIVGLPQDHDGAQALFDQDPHTFQLWAVSLIPDAQNWKGGKKGSDTGIDGQVYLRTGKAESHRAMISVKGGRHVGVAMVRDFAHVIDREKALLGLFLTLTPPTRDMETEAVKAGYVETDQGRFRKLQILTIDELLNGRRPEMPFIDSTAFKRARREDSGGTQGELGL